MQQPAIGPLVRRFFSALDEASLPWAVLRGSAGLPDETRYDIDLLLDHRDLVRAERLLIEAAGAIGWSVVRILDKYRYRCCLAISPGPVRRYLPVDLFGGCLHRFYPMADSDYGLGNRIRNDAGVWVVPDGFGAAVALIKELMRHPIFKENSRIEVHEGASSDPESFRAAISGILGESLGEKLLLACQAGDWDAVHDLIPQLRCRVSGTRSRLSSAAFGFFLGNLRHHLRSPMHAFVVMLGPDGSGKSTIADQVAERLYQKPFKVCRRFEYQFRILPELKQLKRKFAAWVGRAPTELKTAPEPGTRGSGMNRDHHPVVGMGYVTYYTLDFILGHLLLRKLRAQGAAVLFARYFHDYYYQLGYRRVPRWYLRLLECLVPKPDLILYLDRDALEIYQMKPELDVEEIVRQQQAIRQLVAQRPQAAEVDASGGVEATVAEVTALVQQIFIDRSGCRAGPPGRPADLS